MRILFSTTLCLFMTTSLFSQIIWSENFNSYADGTTTGAGNSWNGTCPGCLTGDYFEVRSGQYSGGDVNDFATWESEPIDMSGYPLASFSLDASETGDHEGPGCNCGVNVDYFDVYYSIDGGPFTIIQDWNGDGTTQHTLTGDSNNGSYTDSDWGSTTITQGGLSGSTLVIRVEMRNTSGSEKMNFDNIIVTGIIPLPVELMTFDGTVDNGEVYLKWETISEKNNDYFEIEKSFDGNAFTSIGKVHGQGTTTQHSFYSFIDEQSNNITYYRLRQVDFDGTASYSNIISINVKPTQIKTPYPNPFSSNLFIELNEASEIQITSLDGRSLITAHLKTGSHNIYALLENFASGIVFLRITSNSDSEVFTLEKLD